MAESSPQTESETELTEAVKILRNGGVVVLPSDTLYALVACAQDAAAVDRVFAIKGRDNTKALPLFVADVAMAERCAVLNDLARRLVVAFWPGALTVVLPKQPGFDSAALSDGDTVALRVPNHDLLRDVIRQLDAPLTATSANRSGGPAPVTAAQVKRQLGSDVDYVLDAGPCAVGVSSTIVDCCGAEPVLLRQGAISKDAIDRALATF